MAIAPLRQNPNPEQIAVNLIGRTVADNKAPGIAESASVMNATPKFVLGRNPAPRHVEWFGPQSGREGLSSQAASSI